MIDSVASCDDLRTRLLTIAHAREGNAETLQHGSQQLLEIRAVIRHNLETPWPEGRGSAAERQERVRRLGELIVQDLDAQEELGSQFGAGLAITRRLRSLVLEMRDQGVEVFDLLSRLDQTLPTKHEDPREADRAAP